MSAAETDSIDTTAAFRPHVLREYALLSRLPRPASQARRLEGG